MKVDSKPFLKTKSTKTLEHHREPNFNERNSVKLRGPSELNEKNLYLFNKQ